MRFLTKDYAAHAAFIAPARASAALWRLLLGVVLAVATYFGVLWAFFAAIIEIVGKGDTGVIDVIFAGQSPGALLVLLFSFAVITLASGLTVWVVHRRGVLTLFGAVPLVIRQFTRVFLALLVLGAAILLLPPWDAGGPLTPNVAPGLWVMLLPLSLLGVLIQTSAEEIFFRGYLQQQLAARFASPLVWMLIPSVIFGVGHYMPAEAGENAVTIALWATVFGLLMADLTARAGTLGPAMAVHFFTNINAMLVVSMQGDLSGLSLYVASFGLEDTAIVAAWLPVDFLHMFVTWLVARLVLRR